jgi:hypothetical protein
MSQKVKEQSHFSNKEVEEKAIKVLNTLTVFTPSLSEKEKREYISNSNAITTKMYAKRIEADIKRWKKIVSQIVPSASSEDLKEFECSYYSYFYDGGGPYTSELMSIYNLIEKIESNGQR